MRRLRLAAAAGLAVTVATALAGCGSAPEAAGGPERLRVAVSVPPQAYFVERIGGDRVEVVVMIPPGYSHVDHPLTPRKMAALSEADLYVKVGHPAFDWERQQIGPVLEGMPGLRVVDMSAGMRFLETGAVSERPRAGDGDLHDGHRHEGGDPHVWVAPATVAVAADNIARALAEADPAHAAEYRASLAAFQADLRELDGELRARLSGLPHRAFLVYHPTWGYFAQEYGLEQIAIEAEGKEPSAGRLMELIGLAREEHVRVIFVQSGFPRKSAQVIADAVGARVVTADPQEYDWPGTLRRVAAELEEALSEQGPEEEGRG
jgi:zinc transport system substrate-binding protein